MSEPELPDLQEFLRQRQALRDAAARDPRYRVEAYVLVCESVGHARERLGERRHITARELLEGLCHLAVERYGYLADLVLVHWGVTSTADVGNIVFTLIEVNLLSKSEEDRPEDFHNVFDLRETLRQCYQAGLRELDTEGL